jgi:hypothetical protein
MLAFVLLVESTPVMMCAVCSVFLAHKDRFQWMWFAALAVLVELGGLAMLSTLNAYRLTM